MPHNALIFDFDGTIADTLAEGMRIYNEIASENGYLEVDHERLTELRSFDTPMLLRELGIPKRSVPLLLTRGRRMLKAKIRSLPLIPGMGETLPRLRERAEFFGILTSNATDNVEAFLEAHGLRDLFTFVSSTNKLTGKAKHLRSIMRTFSLELPDMLYIGDEIRDIRAARRAGVAAAAVTWGLNSEESLAAQNPRFLVHRPHELLALAGP